MTLEGEHDHPELEARVAALETEPPKPPDPGPVPPEDSTIVKPGDPVELVDGGVFLLREGTHRLAWGSGERHESRVAILEYPGEHPVIDGTDLSDHFLYLGAGASFLLGAIELRGFAPYNSAVIAYGDDCILATAPGFRIQGDPDLDDPTSHGLYGHGTGVAILDQPDIQDVPGSAIQHYRGSPRTVVRGGKLGGRYISSLIYSGTIAMLGTAFVDHSAAWDIQVSGATATLQGCTGTGSGGSVRRIG